MINSMRKACWRLIILMAVITLLSMMPTAYAENNVFYSNGIWTKIGLQALNYYHHETKKSTTVYADSDFTQPIGTVSVHTFVRPIFDPSIPGPYVTNTNGLEALHCQYITYPDARTGSGWMHTENIGPCCVTVGYTTYHYLEYINVYLPSQTPDHNDQSDSNSGSQGNTGSSGQSSSDSGSTSTTKKNSSTKKKTKKTTTTKTTESTVNTDVLWQGKKVSVKTWGFYNSVIVVDGEKQTIPTHELTFSEKVDADKHLAYILAPRTGRCYLRTKASAKGEIFDKCKAGTVVQVVKYGKSYCQIVYEGQVGYVQTACLTFLNPAAEMMGTMVLTYNGKATGAAQVPIRNTASNDSASVMKLRSGTEVTVFAKSGNWYEVEYEGVHGYVHKNFLRLNE